MLGRLFPKQRSSVRKLVLQGCSGDVVKAIEHFLSAQDGATGQDKLCERMEAKETTRKQEKLKKPQKKRVVQNNTGDVVIRNGPESSDVPCRSPPPLILCRTPENARIIPKSPKRQSQEVMHTQKQARLSLLPDLLYNNKSPTLSPTNSSTSALDSSDNDIYSHAIQQPFFLSPPIPPTHIGDEKYFPRNLGPNFPLSKFTDFGVYKDSTARYFYPSSSDGRSAYDQIKGTNLYFNFPGMVTPMCRGNFRFPSAFPNPPLSRTTLGINTFTPSCREPR